MLRMPIVLMALVLSTGAWLFGCVHYHCRPSVLRAVHVMHWVALSRPGDLCVLTVLLVGIVL
jgi:hypothetical protein